MHSVVCLYGTEVVIAVDLQLFVKYGRIKDGLIRKLSDLSYIRLGSFDSYGSRRRNTGVNFTLKIYITYHA